MTLERFVTVQEHSYATTLQEIRSGQKTGHWMWFIFPQLQGLGHSETSRYYAIRNLQEVESYLNHPVLEPRLQEISIALLGLPGTNPRRIFGSIDAMKMRSSMTPFYQASHFLFFTRCWPS